MTEALLNDYKRLELVIPQTEVLFTGAFYAKPDLYIENGQFIKSKYDLFDDATKFYYDQFELMYKTFSQEFTITNVNAFMSQDTERFATYKRFGGYKTIEDWVNLTNIDDFKNYYDLIKKYSLLRELYRNGYPVERIKRYKKFDELSATEIYRIMRSKVDSIHTVILANEDSVNIVEETSSSILKHIEAPDMGLSMPYPVLNDLFKGIRKKIMLVVGMLSNDGKTRYMAKLATYLAFFHGEKVLLMLNETTEEEIRNCIITTVINNSEFQALHGIQLNKHEREITLGQYRDNNGNIIHRKTDANGNYIESLDEFVSRLESESDEFNKVMQIAKWVEEESKGKIFVKEMVDYKDEILEFEIRKHKITKGIDYFFYDTLKNDNDSIGDWAAFKKTTTMLSELCKEIDVFMYGSIQLTDESVHLDIFDLTSMNIANAKQIKHLLDQLCLMKRIPKESYHKYSYLPIEFWGESKLQSLDGSKTYYGSVVDKNRAGEKKVTLFEVDLNKNTWYEVGTLVKGGV